MPFLSVGHPVQHALPALLASAETAARAIRERTRENLARSAGGDARLGRAAAPRRGRVVRRPAPPAHARRGGLGARVHRGRRVRASGRVLRIPEEAHVVVSLLTPSRVFGDGVARLVARVARDA